MRSILSIPGIVFLLLLAPNVLHAEQYTGGGISAGASAISGIAGIADTEPRDAIANVINEALTYVALIAVAVVVIAGFYLILSLGDESGKEKAKKILIYTAAGIIVLGLAKAIVLIFISFVD